MRQDHRMTLSEAYNIGQQILKLDSNTIKKAEQVARELAEMRTQDLGPMTLALALLGVSKAHRSDVGLQQELMDALGIVARAEKEYWTHQKAAQHGRVI